MLGTKMDIRSTQSLCLLGLVGFISTASSIANAQQFEDPASLQFGGFDVIPTVDVGLRYNDNVTRAFEDEITSWSRIVAPQVSMVSSLGASQVNFGYRLVNEEFFSSKEDNYTDHFLTAGVELELGVRHRVNATLDYEDGHEARGTNFSIGAQAGLTEPDQFKQSQFDVLYSYGAFNADGRIDVNINLRSLDYDIATLQYLVRDREIASLGTTFYYRVGATTDATFDVKVTDTQYKVAAVAANTLDSVTTSYLVGLKWEATAQSSGFAKVGYQEKDFDSSLREDFSGVDWEAGVLWEPVNYASIELITSADTNETNGEGNFIRGRNHSVEWRHAWLERLRSSARVAWVNDRYEGQLIDGFNIRSDDYLRLNASVYYQFRRWLNIEVGYIFNERDSNRIGIDFDQNQFVINALITL